MIWNTLMLAFRSIRRNVLRSFLTILGIVIGVAAVVTMVTIGNGATRSVQDQIASMGSNLLLIRPGQSFGPGSGGAAPFDTDDTDAIRNQISGVTYVAPVVNASGTAVYGANNWATSVVGSNNDYFGSGNWEFAAGREFSEAELRAGRTVCVLGESVRKELFGTGNPLGAEIRVRQFACEVIGVLKPKGQSAFGSDQDDAIVMPLKTVQRRLTGNQNVSRISVSVASEGQMARVQDAIEGLLRERRNVTPAEDNDFRMMDTRQISEAFTSTTRVMTMLLGSVAAVSLLVGGIGIMNIMLVSVTERTREIGIRLAIGAVEREVLLQFLIEAVVLSSLGGVVGLLLATGASIGLSDAMQVPYVFDPGINVLAFGFSAAIGVVFGFFPARRAARLDPIEALRHE